MSRYLADTNILLRLVDSEASEHELVKNAVGKLLKRGDDAVLVPQTMYEFWATGTRPVNVNGFGWTASYARREVEGLLENFKLLPDSPDLFNTWLELVTTHDVKGKQVHDARLVATMQTHNLANLLTLNVKDFERYPVMPVHPDVVSEG